jgi:mono/diheme cytochrome c family protein
MICSWGVAVALSAALCGAAERMPPEQARGLENPVGYSAETVREGRKTYLRLCQYCHGADGRAQANPDFEAPSLRAPSEWRYGSSDGEMFISIRDGAGHEMPPFGKQLADDQIWQLVRYVRSIGPKELRTDSAGQGQ